MKSQKLDKIKDQPCYNWLLAVTAPMLLWSWGTDWSQIWMATEFRDGSFEENRKPITESWGIQNHDDLVETINRLLSLDMHGYGGRGFFDQIALTGKHKQQEIIDNLESDQLRDEFRFHQMAYDLVGNCRFFGFDLMRATYLSRHGFVSGWLSEDEMLFFLSYAARKIQYLFPDWATYHSSYILGRVFWRYSVNDEGPEILFTDGSFTCYSQFYSCLNLPNAPVWDSLPFDLQLPIFDAPESLFLKAQEEQKEEA